MTLEEILTAQRQIWGDKKMALAEISIALTVVTGDIARLARHQQEGKTIKNKELEKELGNIINSAVRWADDLGFSAKNCVERSTKAHQEYTEKLH